jgi:hypothetical protein
MFLFHHLTTMAVYKLRPSLSDPNLLVCMGEEENSINKEVQ